MRNEEARGERARSERLLTYLYGRSYLSLEVLYLRALEEESEEGLYSRTMALMTQHCGYFSLDS